MLLEALTAGMAATGAVTTSPAGWPAKAASAPIAVQETDTTFGARDASRLDVENHGGEIVVEGWDRNEVRVRANHSRRRQVEIRRSGGTVYVEAAGNGFSGVARYYIQVPAGFDVSAEGWRTAIEVNGTTGRIDAETFTGNVSVRGGRDRVSASTVNGSLTIADAQGDVTAESVSGTIRIAGAEGWISAETMSGTVRVSNSRGSVVAEAIAGAVILDAVAAASVEATTVGGSIEFKGETQPDGDYYFNTHGGRILLELPSSTNAVLEVHTASGRVRIDHPAAVPQENRSRRYRSTYTLGAGGALIEVETYSGTIVVRPPGS